MKFVGFVDDGSAFIAVFAHCNLATYHRKIKEKLHARLP